LSADVGLATGAVRFFDRGLHQLCFVRVRVMDDRARPSRLRTDREQRAGQAADKVGLGTCRGEGETDAPCDLDDAGCDFQEAKPQRRAAHTAGDLDEESLRHAVRDFIDKVIAAGP
jgi:hypothetical protein